MTYLTLYDLEIDWLHGLPLDVNIYDVYKSHISEASCRVLGRQSRVRRF